MPSCVFKDCKNCSQKLKLENGVSFHRFPAESVLHDKWVSIIRKSRQDNNWTPSKFCVICSAHFKEEDVYYTEKGRRLIKKGSKPIPNIATPKIEDVATASFTITQIPGPSIEVSPSPDSDLESIFDTPRKSHLRKELRKHQLLRVATKRKLKTLQEKVRRLKKRNSLLNSILKDICKRQKFHKLRYS